MSVSIVERAKAFELLSPFLSAEQKDDIAKKLGAHLVEGIELKKSPAVAPHEAETLPDPERLPYDKTAKFLADHGYSSGDQVRAAGRLEEFLKKHPHLTREAGMRVWLTQDLGMSR
ncbi:hypothetical protein [Microbacterium paludicola]|uniref:hypothetical protein n=1 Tax=Microbacterium paludicola TaxID=300019 RepID=UPI0011A708EE|nr:hypothetical protein [Microbacterium paludicola]